MIGQNTHSRNIFSVHGFLNLSVTERNQKIFSKGEQTIVSGDFAKKLRRNFSLMFSSCNPFSSKRSAAKRTQL